MDNIVYQALEYIIEYWNIFFWSSSKPFTLSLFRIAIGTIIIIHGIYSFVHFKVLFSTKSLIDFTRTGYHKSFTIFTWIPKSDLIIRLVILVLIINGLSIIVGLLTKVNLIISFLILNTLFNSNKLITNAGDVILRIFIFLLIFSPCNHLLSIDNHLFNYDTQKSIWAQRLLQIFFCSIYIKTVIHKIHGRSWKAGSAIYYAININYNSIIQFPNFLNKKTIYRLMTYSTLIIQCLVSILIWVPDVSNFIIASGVLLHLGIMMFIGLYVFQLTMISGYLLFL